MAADWMTFATKIVHTTHGDVDDDGVDVNCISITKIRGVCSNRLCRFAKKRIEMLNPMDARRDAYAFC